MPRDSSSDSPGPDELDRNEVFVKAFRDSLYGTDGRMGGFLRLLKEILREGCWKKRRLETGRTVEFERFEDFVTKDPPDGLHEKVDLIRKLISGDIEAQELLDKALRREPGRPAGVGETVNNVNGFGERPMGNSSAQALRKLRVARPDLHDRVIAGDLTPNAAMVLAGFRKRHYSIDLEDAFIAAKAIRKHASPEYIASLITFLSET